jgi:hypothetical protein
MLLILISVNIKVQLTAWRRAIPEKLTGPQLVKKVPAFYGTSKVHYSIHKRPPPVPILSERNPGILILSSCLRLGLPSSLFSSGLSSKIQYAPLLYPIRATCPAPVILLDLITRNISQGLGHLLTSYINNEECNKLLVCRSSSTLMQNRSFCRHH